MEGTTQQPQICKDCQAEYTLTPGELDFYTKKMQEEQGFSMPKRCGKCRAKKKLERMNQRGQQFETPKKTFDEFDKEL